MSLTQRFEYMYQLAGTGQVIIIIFENSCSWTFFIQKTMHYNRLTVNRTKSKSNGLASIATLKL